MANKYTDEINAQILISLLKKHNIKKVIASPGTTHISFLASIQNDEFFEIYSCVDERSACYMACGLATESGEPVVLTCTGATASRNYISGLTEAYYRKLPIIAITGAQHPGRIGQHIAQVIDRSNPLNDMVKVSILADTVHSEEDRWACNLNINKALLECRHNGGGPVHINLVSTYSNNFDVPEIPSERKIDRIESNDNIPLINSNNVAIFVGSHKKWSDNLTKEVEEFCQKYNAVVLCDHTSNYHGKYKIMPNLICDQNGYFSPLKNIDTLIHIGDVSGAYISLNPKTVWRVNPDGEIRDPFKKLRYVFEMDELEFFKKYNNSKEVFTNNEYYQKWLTEQEMVNKKLKEIDFPFSNIWVAQNTIDLLPENSILHLGILNTLRSWNYFSPKQKLFCYSNTGGFGIDGNVSSLIGASLNNPSKKVYGIVGDLAFFYDMNSLGNREIQNNLRLIVINNGCGAEFHLARHRASKLDSGMAEKFIAADGHNGNKSKKLVKDYAEDLGFDYLSASNKEEYLTNIKRFINDNEKSIIFEIFTDAKLESDALNTMNNLVQTFSGKQMIKNVIGEKNINRLKKIIKK